jgi:hypothetical protein
MRKPTIHLNGTDAQSLFDGYYEALQAVQTAQAKLMRAAPHGRDYYVQEPTPGIGKDAINEALDEHLQRLQWLENIERDLERLAHHVMDEAEARGKAVRT